MNNIMIEINDCPLGLETEYQTLFTKKASNFLAELFLEFEPRINQLYYDRCLRKYELKKSTNSPQFLRTKQRQDKTWMVKPVPGRLADRRLDLGDVSPSNSNHFYEALNAEVQGIQVDFDDGHCPTWRNQIVGLYNVYKVVHGKDDKILKSLKELPILMLRPRAWNMTEHNIMINGKKIPGAVVDFAILMYHNGSRLYEENSGPCFYLSKLESATEARLWNDIFIWTQNRLNIPHASIKACVLIENILASFEMEEILFELKDHSLGLNCGIWDYAASIIAKFGNRSDFILPDRNKYVNMKRHFLKKYMELVVQVCHSRGAHATGGMAAQIANGVSPLKAIISKILEIQAGVDGFMVYDVELVPYMNQLWNKICNTKINQLDRIPTDLISEADLLKMPSGGVTNIGLKHNVEVSILFVYNWLCGNGHFTYKDSVEDSATAEISRSQVWQWITHTAKLEENGEIITFELIRELTQNFVKSTIPSLDKKYLIAAANIFLDIVSSAEPPDFITTYLNDHYVFRRIHGSSVINRYNHKL